MKICKSDLAKKFTIATISIESLENDYETINKHDYGAMPAIATGGLVASVGSMAADKKAEMEKCYGVAKAGKNDCQTATSACAGTSK